MMWLTLLKKFWPYIAGALLLLGAWLWYREQLQEADQAGYKRAQAEYTAELENARKQWQKADEETQRDHETQLTKIREDAARELLGRPIRCVRSSPAKVSEVRVPTDPGEPAGSPGGEPAGELSENLRPRIVVAGSGCEKMRQQLIVIKARQDSLRQSVE